MQRIGHHPKVVAHQGNIGRLQRCVGPGSDGDPEVGAGEYRGVVEAVAYHRNPAVGGLQVGEFPALPLRVQARHHPVDTHCLTNPAGNILPVTGQHHHFESEASQGGYRLGRPGAHHIGQGHYPDRMVVNRDNDRGGSLLNRRTVKLPGEGAVGATYVHHPTGDRAGDSESRSGPHVGRFGWPGYRRGHGTSDRVLRVLFHRSGQSQNLVGIPSLDGRRGDHSHAPLGEGAGLVEGNHGEIPGLLDGPG